MKKKLVVSIAAVAGALALLVPVSSSAKGACVVIHRGNVNIQVGYAPNGPSGCKQL